MQLLTLRILALVCGAGFTTLAAAVPSDYRVVTRFHIGGEGAYDYLRVDAAARRLYVTHGTRIEVLDADSGAKVGELTGLQRAHGVAIAPESGHGFATSGGDAQILMFDLTTLRVIKTIKSTGKNPDAIEYDAGTKRVYAANHSSGSVIVLDAVSGDVVGTVTFGEGALEGLGFDGRGRGYVNAEDKSAVFVFDLKTLTPVAKWSSAPGEGGTGLIVDGAHHRVVSACGNGKLVVFDSDSGKVVATPQIDEDPDALVFEPATQRLFVPCVGGTLNIVQEVSPDRYTVLQTVTTATGCRTITLDEKTGHVFTAAPKYGPQPESGPGEHRKRPPALPDTFEALVIGAK
jgi:DNA-binding beta-propeller fold protein YncE